MPVNNFAVMLRRSHLSLGITSTFGEYMPLAQGNNTPTRPRIDPGSPDPESDALTIRPVRSPSLKKDQLEVSSSVLCIYTIHVNGKLGQAGEHTFIQKTLKHLHLSIYNRKY